MQQAELDPWSIVVVDGNDHLFGYLISHPRLSGKSWALSTPIQQMVWKSAAITASGTRYRLRNQIGLTDLPEEGQIALGCLLQSTRNIEPDPRAVQWLQACKIARWLDLGIPDRRDTKAVAAFIKANHAAYTFQRGVSR